MIKLIGLPTPSVAFFTLSIEPLVMAIGEHEGITIGGREHQISLCAYILFLTALKESVPSLINLIETFGGFPRYEINKSKSVCLLLNKEVRQKPLVNTPFMASKEGPWY